MLNSALINCPFSSYKAALSKEHFFWSFMAVSHLHTLPSIQKTESLPFVKLLHPCLIKASAFQFVIEGHVHKAHQFCWEIMLDPFLSYTRFTTPNPLWLPMSSPYLLPQAAQTPYSDTIITCPTISQLTTMWYFPHEAKHTVRGYWKQSQKNWLELLQTRAFQEGIHNFTPPVQLWQWYKNAHADNFTLVSPGSDHQHPSFPHSPFCTEGKH